MKTNYYPGDKIKSKKLGILNGLEGEVLSNNKDKASQQLSVICGNLGSWNFSYSEVEFLGKEKPEKDSIDKPKAIKVVDSKESTVKNKADKPVKRAYQKRDKSEPAKQKRAYNRKTKT